ncbi:MAG: hypothetical protein KH073_20035 [Clostridium sp.]|uniref:hypothetical protein n=1 Tax=Clostridium TaxID=1485 RepID=UPI000C06E623|nr:MULTISPECIES: hypothetical protein [Clostridium]MBS4843121.1 hypothetical protein [Clostridium sp.]
MGEKKYKNINVKVDEKLVERVNYYRTLEENGVMSQADFVIKALDEKCQRIKRLRSGGMILSIPNPDMFIKSESQKHEILKVLAECSINLKKINPGLSFGIDEIMIYAKQHMFEMTNKQQQELQENFYSDLKFEEGVE